MVRTLITGIVVLFVLLILMWTLLNPQKKWVWRRYTPLRIAVLMIFIVLFSVIYALYNWGVNKTMTEAEILNEIQNLRNEKIRSLMFFYESNEYKFRDTIFIKSDTIIEKFSSALSISERFHPNHASVRWAVNLKINTEDDKLKNIRLCIMEDQRDDSFYFRIIKETQLGNLYMGAYLNKEIYLLLKKYYFENNKIQY